MLDAPPVYRHVVRFSEVDAAGIAFFTRLFEWCHHAWEDALHRALGPWFQAMGREGWGLPLVHADAAFRRPARLGDALTVSIAGLRLDGGRLRIRFTIDGVDDVRHAEIEHVHAFVDLKTFRRVDPPADVLERLRAAGLEIADE
ncbi:MAG: acyl-CoA thioesterase [Nannocystaceae bacterium]